jgi:predicted CXXCH cytochrome family protein
MTNFKRLIISLVFALFLAGATLVMTRVRNVEAAPVPASADQGTSSDCAGCHSEISISWTAGLHGHAGNDPVFQNSWEAQGKPGACLVCHVTGYDPASATWREEGVTCEACHSPIPTEHITKPSANPVPVDRSSDLCGRCHSDTRFGWEQWKVSAHYQRDMTCSVCHDPHTAAIKTMTGTSGEPLDASALCLNCHRDYSMKITYTTHSQNGVECVDCHLRHYGTETGADVHAMPDHSFVANVTSCNTCHSTQMHSSTEGATPTMDEAVTTISEAASTDTGNVTSKPSPVSPAGFAGLAGLLGLAGGMVLAPWLEMLYRKWSSPKEGKKKK